VVSESADPLSLWRGVGAPPLFAELSRERSEESRLVREQDEMLMPNYFVYIMSNASRTLYVGVTNNLERRVYEHKQKLTDGFTSKYNITQLVYYEETPDIYAAITREKQIKGWLRARKVALIESMNPTWTDLSNDW